MQGQHRAVSPGDVTKTPHVATVFWFNPLPGICGSLAVLAGPEAGSQIIAPRAQEASEAKRA